MDAANTAPCLLGGVSGLVANPNARCFEDESSRELLNIVLVVLLVLCAIMMTVMVIGMIVGVFKTIKAEFRQAPGATSSPTRRNGDGGDSGPILWAGSYDSGGDSGGGDGGGGGGD